MMEWTVPRPHSSTETFENKQKSLDSTLPELRKTLFGSKVNAGAGERQFKMDGALWHFYLSVPCTFPSLAATLKKQPVFSAYVPGSRGSRAEFIHSLLCLCMLTHLGAS